jgi:hypothetical protein
LVVRVLRDHEHKAEETVLRASWIRPGEVTRSLRRIIQDFAPASSGATDSEVAEQRWALGPLTGLLRARARALQDEDFWAIHAELPLESLSMSQAALWFYRAVVDSRPCGQGENSTDLVALTARVSQAVYTGPQATAAKPCG